MKISVFALIAASVSLGFMSETTDVVLATVKGSTGKVRINKSDFEADQLLPTGERQYSAAKDDETVEQSDGAGVKTFADLETDGVRIQAAPSAPNFNGGEGGVKPIVDSETGAIAPVAPSPNSRIVMREGDKFFVCDGMGIKLTDGSVEEKGYKSEKAAQDAIAKLPR